MYVKTALKHIKQTIKIINKPMKTYKIQVSYQMSGIMEIEAESLDEAKEMVFDSDQPLPKDASYIDGSLELDDYEIIEDMNK
jgi:hypothetical protein